MQLLNPMEAIEPSQIGMGLFIAIVSALSGRAPYPGLAVVGDMSVQGAILEPDAIGEMVLLAREGGASRLVTPAGTLGDIAGLPPGLTEGVGINGYESSVTAVEVALAASIHERKPETLSV